MADNPTEIGGKLRRVPIKTVQDSTTVSATNFGTCYQTIADAISAIEHSVGLDPIDVADARDDYSGAAYASGIGYITLLGTGSVNAKCTVGSTIFVSGSPIEINGNGTEFTDSTKGHTRLVAVNDAGTEAVMVASSTGNNAEYIHITNDVRTSTSLGVTDTSQCVLYESGAWYVALSAAITTSTDGASWSTKWTETNTYDMAGNDAGRVVAIVGTAVKYADVADATMTTVTLSSVTYGVPHQVVYDEMSGNFIAISNTTTNAILYSSDGGATWLVGDSEIVEDRAGFWGFASGSPATADPTQVVPNNIISTKNGAFVDSDIGILYSSDGGATWRKILESQGTLLQWGNTIGIAITGLGIRVLGT